MPEPIYAIGIGRTDFKRNLKKENKTIRDVIVEAGRAAGMTVIAVLQAALRRSRR